MAKFQELLADRKKRKTLALGLGALALIIIVALTVKACGSGDETQTAAAEPEASQEVAEEALPQVPPQELPAPPEARAENPLPPPPPPAPEADAMPAPAEPPAPPEARDDLTVLDLDANLGAQLAASDSNPCLMSCNGYMSKEMAEADKAKIALNAGVSVSIARSRGMYVILFGPYKNRPQARQAFEALSGQDLVKRCDIIDYTDELKEALQNK